MYKLDKSAFKINSFKEADNNYAYWMQKTPYERFAAAWYLIACAWGFSLDNPPQMYKSVYSSRKQEQ